MKGIEICVTSSPVEAARAARHDAQPSRAHFGGAADDSSGWSVAASGDTVVVGAHLDKVNNNAHQGSA